MYKLKQSNINNEFLSNISNTHKDNKYMYDQRGGIIRSVNKNGCEVGFPNKKNFDFQHNGLRPSGQAK